MFSYVAVAIYFFEQRRQGRFCSFLDFFFLPEFRWVISLPYKLVVEMMFSNCTCLNGDPRKGGIRKNRILKELKKGIISGK